MEATNRRCSNGDAPVFLPKAMNRVKRFVGFAGISGNDQYPRHFLEVSVSSEGLARSNFESERELGNLLEDLRKEAAGVDHLPPYDLRRTCAHLYRGICGRDSTRSRFSWIRTSKERIQPHFG